MSDLISIVVPVYNCEKYLNKCVQSLLTQTYQNIEVILVDDGSTDSSPEMCDSYAASDGRVKVMHIRNDGVAVARKKDTRRQTATISLFWTATTGQSPTCTNIFCRFLNPVIIKFLPATISLLTMMHPAAVMILMKN